MNKETFEKLRRFEPNFQTAVQANWCRNVVRKDREMLAGEYRKITGSDRVNIDCGSCLLDIMKALGERYYAYKEEKESDGKISSERESGAATKKGEGGRARKSKDAQYETPGSDLRTGDGGE